MVDSKFVTTTLLSFVGVLFFLYFFLVSLDVLGSSFKIAAGESAGSLFTSVDNPVAGLMVGIIATVLVQSSSTTTSIIVTAVGSGVLPLQTAIPMIFGANIGTSVTNTIVALGFITNNEQLERGFGGATVHDMFNYMNVLLWFPLEVISEQIFGTGPLEAVATTINFNACDEDEDTCEKWEGPLKVITSFVSKAIISADSDVIKDFALGRPDAESCEILCSDDGCGPKKFSQKRCYTAVNEALAGLTTNPAEMECDFGAESDAKAAFQYCEFNSTSSEITVLEDTLEAAQSHYDSYVINKGGFLADAGLQETAGVIMIVVSILTLCVSLIGLVKCLQRALGAFSEEAIKKALNMNGYLAILVGTGITIFVQSSSITTSTLTPLVALGSLTVEGMLPLTLGANIGTTITGILAALAGDNADGFTIALVHVLFNVFGVVIFYPIPFIRAIPIRAAKGLGVLAGKYKAFPIVYIGVLFFFYPGYLLGTSVAFSEDLIAVGVLLVVLFIFVHTGIFYWYHKRGGREYLVASFGLQKEGKDLSGISPAGSPNDADLEL